MGKHMKKRLKHFGEQYIENSSLAVIAASAVGAIFAAFWVITLVIDLLYEGTVVYDSLIAGTLSFYDYFKQGDKWLVYIFLFGSVIFFYLIMISLNYIKKKESYKIPSFYAKLGLVVFYLYNVITQQVTYQQTTVFVILLLSLFLCGKSREKLEALIQFIAFGEIFATAVVLIGSKIGDVVGLNWGAEVEVTLAVVQLVVLLLAIIYPLLYGKKIKPCKMHRFNFILQMCSILWIFWYVVFVYEYQGEVVVHYFSAKYLAVALIVAIIVTGMNIHQLRTNSFEQSFMAKGSIEIAAIFTYLKIPNALIQTAPISMFHNGEYTITSQQLSSYGKIPFWDIFPIHGLGDYYYGIINELFFDGRYANLEAAFVLGDIIILAVLAAVIKRSCKNSTAALAVILLLFNFTEGYAMYYIRWVFVLPYLMILNTRKIYKNSAARVWLYVMLTMASVCWNPSIGGSAAIALLPVLLKDIFIVAKETIGNIQKKQLSRKFCVAYGVMVAAGMLFIPVFVKIVKYLLLHMENILIVNSNPLTYLVDDYTGDTIFSVASFEENYVYILFSFLIPVMGGLIIRQMVKKEAKRSMGEIVAQFVIFTFFITSYTFGLICAGERAFIYSGILILFLMFYLVNTSVLEKHQWHKYMILLLLIFSIKIVNSTDYTDTETVFASRGIIADNAVYVTADSSNVSQIQESYMSTGGLEYINGANDIVELAEARDEVLDLSNMVSITSILDLDLITPYTSAYNMYNETMQKDVLEILEQKQPKVVLLSPYFSDGRPLVTRNYWIIRWLQEKEYEPYIYQGNLFLARKDVKVDWAEDGYSEYNDLLTANILEMLPYYWGSQEIKDKYIETSDKLYIDYTSIEDGKTISIDEPAKVSDFLRVTVYSEDMLQAKAKLGVKCKGKEMIYFEFNIKNGEMLLPVGISPEIRDSEEIEQLELEIIDVDVVTTAEVMVYAENTIETSQLLFTKE